MKLANEALPTIEGVTLREQITRLGSMISTQKPCMNNALKDLIDRALRANLFSTQPIEDEVELQEIMSCGTVGSYAS